MLTKQQIPADELEQILCRFALGKIEKIEPLATSGNISYLIVTADKKYFLRLCPQGPRWRSREEIAAEIELLRYLSGRNFPVIMPVADSDNQEIINWQEQYGYLREYQSGLAKLSPTLDDIKEFGQLLGWLHSLTENFSTVNKRGHIFDLAKTIKEFNEAKATIALSEFKQADNFIGLFEKEINDLQFPSALPQGMIHEDLGKRHVLWQDNKIMAVVDFDRSYFGPLIFDLGEAIRGWCFVNNWRHFNLEIFYNLINSYQQKRVLTKEEKLSLVQAVKFAVLERALAFCLRFIEDTHDPDDADYAWLSLTHLISLIEGNKKAITRL